MKKRKGVKIMRFQKIILAILTAIMCCTVSVNGYAAMRDGGDNGIVAYPQYEISKQPTITLSISGKTATGRCSLTVLQATVDQIDGTLTLQKKSGSNSWSDVSGASWSKTVNTLKLTLSGTKDDLSSGTYRTKAVFTVTTTSGISETITVYSGERPVV